MAEIGLDHAFLMYNGVSPEIQRRDHAFYLDLFAGCASVIDLGCGSGYFLDMLAERGTRTLGVDMDPRACAEVTARGQAAVCADVLDYLRTAPPEQFDGAFCAHLVEHMPYEAVLELLRGAFRVLKPGGRLVIATPNARSLFAHLEMYHRHFGHVAFYHPELLRFFLDYTGFREITTGANPAMPVPGVWGGDLRGRVLNENAAAGVQLPPFAGLYAPPHLTPPPLSADQAWVARAQGLGLDVSILPTRQPLEPLPAVPLAEPPAVEDFSTLPPDMQDFLALPPDVQDFSAPPPAVEDFSALPQPVTVPPFELNRSLPTTGTSFVHRLILRVKNWVATWFVLPYIDEIVMKANAANVQLAAQLQAQARALAQTRVQAQAQARALAHTQAQARALAHAQARARALAHAQANTLAHAHAQQRESVQVLAAQLALSRAELDHQLNLVQAGVNERLLHLATAGNAALVAVRGELNELHARIDELIAQSAAARNVNAAELAELELALRRAYAQIDEKLQIVMAELNGASGRMVTALESLDPSWECYAVGVKPAPAGVAAPQAGQAEQVQT